MATMKVLAAGLLPLLLGACQLFIDPAVPPFDDRLVLTRLVDDIFGDLRDETEMTVLDNGSRHFLLVSGRDRHGQRRTVAFDGRLRMRMNRPQLWDQNSAFADPNGDFVIGHSLFSGSDFRLLSDNVYGAPPAPPPPESPATGIQTAAGTVIVRVDGNVLQAGPLYAADWSVSSTEVRDTPLNADPAGGFEWRSARHDPGRGRSGLVLWNSDRSRMFVIEISAQAAAEMQDGSFPGAHVTDEMPHLIISTDKYSSVFYTRRGVVVLHDRHHRVYHRETGSRIATYEYDNGGDFAFAYSPDGKWVYSMDRSRLRLYKARTWW